MDEHSDLAGSRVVESGFAEVAALATKELDGAKGGALSVYVDGASVLDIWSGPKDPTTGEAWAADTMGMAWSTGKAVSSYVLHRLIEQGLVRLDAPVAEYWPEFAANGKETIEIHHLLAMEAGLYDVRHLIAEPAELLDHGRMAELLAGATPLHRPGAKNAYHAFTYGWLVDEVVRRVTGTSVGDIVEREVAQPLGLDGFHMGVPAAQLDRVAQRPVTTPEHAVMRFVAKAIDPLTRIVGFSPARFAAAFLPRGANDIILSDEFLISGSPSINGVFTARSLARFYAALGSDNGLDGVQLWSGETRRQATAEQNGRRDLVVPIRMRWQLGFARPFPRKKMSPEAFGFFGAFGSGAFADPARNLAVGFVCREAQGLPLRKLGKAIVDVVDR